MSLTQAAALVGGNAHGGDNIVFEGVSTDTRTLGKSDLFVALRGARFEGGRFLAQAQAAGAVAAMVEDTLDTTNAPLPTVTVTDTRRALGRLAAHWRGRFSLPLVALTGSSGKTTVKEMLASILREAAGDSPAAVLATRGNLNNDIGVPLMLLEMTPAHRYAVIEMGMNHAGEIRYLTNLAQPTVALITNAGRAHIEFMGSEEAIARAKGEIFEGLASVGTAVINADERFAPMWRELAYDRRRLEFGLDVQAEVRASYRQHALRSEITITTPAGTAEATLHAPGVHNVRNALAAAAAAVALDVPTRAIAAGLERYTGVKGRLQQKPGRHGATLIDDTYNANPESMRAAIAVLSRCEGRRVLVLGDMGELGTYAAELHAELGAFARESSIDLLFALGEHSARTVSAFGSSARHYTRIEELIAELGTALTPETTVLVKGSRFMMMERVVAALAADDGTSTCC